MRRAVVLGGSIAGLGAARVLSEHADEVVIVEPDELSASSPVRPGVPQGSQVHAVLSMGSDLLERWLPGLTDELAAEGAIPGYGDRIEHYVDGVRKVGVPSEYTIGLTRPLLETHVRRRVLAAEGVRLVRGRALALVAEGERVTGVEYVPHDTQEPRTLAADLVVDATGRGTRLDRWLSAAGWTPPALERMNLQLGYATALFKSGEELPGLNVVQAISTPQGPYRDSFAAVRVEGRRWMVVLSAYGEDRPTRDREEFLRRCGAAPVPPIAEIAQQCTLEGEVATYTMADSRRRHFTALSRFPAGLVAVGDAVASFNPVYGQGMTSALLHASCLSAHLRSGAPLNEPAWDYFRRVQVIVDAAWGISTLLDLALPHVDGPYPRGYRFARWYSEQLGRATFTDPGLHRLFLEVAHMRKHPRVLSRPATMLAVARTLLG
ncbi:FAD-dependent oxidoreductase [Streptomyces orinoci]|uniref:FAD-dependent monooxygenase n=1 Tax=Streptomyces orinoci TaxID=67339 RepID=A0ABV3K874_STRON|nr:FAD-dependent monooxygenase [Streptomyces orinoci]